MRLVGRVRVGHASCRTCSWVEPFDI